ncbi:hypothetical protein [Nonomuraea diastatica]
MAGDKAGKWSRWYDEIPLAKARYAEYRATKSVEKRESGR